VTLETSAYIELNGERREQPGTVRFRDDRSHKRTAAAISRLLRPTVSRYRAAS